MKMRTVAYVKKLA